MIEQLDLKKINVELDNIENELILSKNIFLSILRLDKIHPEISGNKFFKLYYFLEQAILKKKKVITFGGAFSNHLTATACACKNYGIKCIGIVRGEEPKNLSHTLLFCMKQGMQLEFISREKYIRKNEKHFKIQLTDKFGDHILIPEGGYSKDGVTGAALISNFYQPEKFDYICCSVGTATTLAGLINSSPSLNQNFLGFSAIKSYPDFENRIQYLLEKPLDKNITLFEEYHFGGYAKKTAELLLFMNQFYEAFAVPTDFVYTGKMMFGVFDLINKNYFPKESRIICIHTGGLQGNLSLPTNSINF